MGGEIDSHVAPDDWIGAKARLIPGVDVAEPYRTKMEAEDFPGCEPG